MTTYVIMAGLPGTGKSTLARILAGRVDGTVLGKDEVRAVLFSGKSIDYSREQDDLCYEVILMAAAYMTAHRSSRFVFLDGRTFSRKEQLDRVIQAAIAAGAEWKILLTVCPDGVARQRIVEGFRLHPAGNRTPEMYDSLRDSFEPIDYPYEAIDTSLPLEECMRRSLRYLVESG